MDIAQMEIQARCDRDEIRALREENDRLRWVVKGAHGALADAVTVVVPGVLDGDIAPAIRRLTHERDEARAKLARVVEIALNGQSRDALHAFGALLKIERLAAAKGE